MTWSMYCLILSSVVYYTHKNPCTGFLAIKLKLCMNIIQSVQYNVHLITSGRNVYNPLIFKLVGQEMLSASKKNFRKDISTKTPLVVCPEFNYMIMILTYHVYINVHSSLWKHIFILHLLSSEYHNNIVIINTYPNKEDMSIDWFCGTSKDFWNKPLYLLLLQKTSLVESIWWIQ